MTLDGYALVGAPKLKMLWSSGRAFYQAPTKLEERFTRDYAEWIGWDVAGLCSWKFYGCIAARRRLEYQWKHPLAGDGS